MSSFYRFLFLLITVLWTQTGDESQAMRLCRMQFLTPNMPESNGGKYFAEYDVRFYNTRKADEDYDENSLLSGVYKMRDDDGYLLLRLVGRMLQELAEKEVSLSDPDHRDMLYTQRNAQSIPKWDFFGELIRRGLGKLGTIVPDDAHLSNNAKERFGEMIGTLQPYLNSGMTHSQFFDNIGKWLEDNRANFAYDTFDANNYTNFTPGAFFPLRPCQVGLDDFKISQIIKEKMDPNSNIKPRPFAFDLDHLIGKFTATHVQPAN